VESEQRASGQTGQKDAEHTADVVAVVAAAAAASGRCIGTKLTSRFLYSRSA